MPARPPNVDIVGIHRDLAGYYRAFGLFDSSTAAALFERAVWPNIVDPGATIAVVGGGEQAAVAVAAENSSSNLAGV